MSDDLEQLLADAFPACELCGADLVPEGPDERPFWRCPACGEVAISR